jgi:hypothetical protein
MVFIMVLCSHKLNILRIEESKQGGLMLSSTSIKRVQRQLSQSSAGPGGFRVKEKEALTIKKYQDLDMEIAKMWDNEDQSSPCVSWRS